MTPDHDQTASNQEQMDYSVIFANLIVVLTHDLRNVISALRMKGELLKIQPDYYDTPGLWKEVSHQVDRFDEMLVDGRSVVSYLQSEVGKEEERSDFVQLVNDTYVLYRTRARTKNIEIKLVVDDTAAVVEASSRLLRYGIIEPLINNAVKFSFPGSEIQVRVTSDGSMVRLAVAGRGEYLDEPTREKLLNSPNRERLRKQGTTGEKGLGFGLYIANELSKRINGEIILHSKMIPSESKKDEEEDHPYLIHQGLTIAVFQMPVMN